MSDKFVPLLAKAPATEASGAFRVTVLTGTAGATGVAVPFQPSAPLISAPPPAHEHSATPQVTLTRDGDRITGIRVQCACGEVIDLQCDY